MGMASGSTEIDFMIDTGQHMLTMATAVIFGTLM
jgi:hypothetical protein